MRLHQAFTLSEMCCLTFHYTRRIKLHQISRTIDRGITSSMKWSLRMVPDWWTLAWPVPEGAHFGQFVPFLSIQCMRRVKLHQISSTIDRGIVSSMKWPLRKVTDW